MDGDPSAEALGYFLPVPDGTINAPLDVNRFSPVYFVSRYKAAREKNYALFSSTISSVARWS